MLITCPKCSVQYQIPEEVRLVSGKKLKCSACQHVFVFEQKQTEDPIVLSEPVVVEPVVVEVEPVVEVQQEVRDNVFADAPVFQEDVPQAFMPVVVPVPPQKKSFRSFGVLFVLIFVVLLVGAGFVYRDVLFAPFSEPFSVSLPKQVVPMQQQKVVQSKPVVVEPKKVVVEAQKVENVPTEPTIIALPRIHSVRFEKRDAPESVVRIEGVLTNETDQTMRLPEKVRAIAYNAQGGVLFEKDIYLADSVLEVEAEQAFFGSHPLPEEEIQWVDVSF